jgi:hypothetical protein
MTKPPCPCTFCLSAFAPASVPLSTLSNKKTHIHTTPSPSYSTNELPPPSLQKRAQCCPHDRPRHVLTSFFSLLPCMRHTLLCRFGENLLRPKQNCALAVVHKSRVVCQVLEDTYMYNIVLTDHTFTQFSPLQTIYIARSFQTSARFLNGQVHDASDETFQKLISVKETVIVDFHAEYAFFICRLKRSVFLVSSAPSCGSYFSPHICI